MFNRFDIAIVTTIAFALAACGGGGSGSMMQQSNQPVIDTDGDGVGDNADAFPQDATETADTDGDGVGDNADAFPHNVSASERSSPHQITTVRENQLGVGDVYDSPYLHLDNGKFVHLPYPPEYRWITATEYRVIGHVLPDSRQLYNSSWYYYGRWEHENMGTLHFGGYQYGGADKLIAYFNVSLENDEITAYATGVKPLTDFADSPATQSLGTAHYYGVLVGLTHNEKQPVGADVNMGFDLSAADITGTFELEALSTIERDGSGKTLLGGTLQHDIAVTGNTFTTTGGDLGTVTGIFAGEGHEAAAGTFQHPAFTGAFSAELDRYDVDDEPVISSDN